MIELRLAPESIEALLTGLAKLAGGDEGPELPEDVAEPQISAEEVAKRWGVSRRWVYDHADELGARRLGAGSRPRLRFEPEEVGAYLGSPLRRPSRRAAAIAEWPHNDSLTGGRRAIVDRELDR